MKIKFLCGCESGNIESRENLLTMDSIETDAEGMLICAVHGSRRYGWRSVPKSDNHPGIKFPYLRLTPVQVEGRIVFKDPLPIFKSPNLKFHNFKDLRDNRDPESIGLRLLEDRRKP